MTGRTFGPSRAAPDLAVAIAVPTAEELPESFDLYRHPQASFLDDEVHAIVARAGHGPDPWVFEPRLQ